MIIRGCHADLLCMKRTTHEYCLSPFSLRIKVFNSALFILDREEHFQLSLY